MRLNAYVMPLVCLGLCVFAAGCAGKQINLHSERIPATGTFAPHENASPVNEARDHFVSSLLSLQQSDGQWSGSFISDATMEAIPLIFIADTGVHDPLVESQSLRRIFALQDPVTHLWLKVAGGTPSIETTGIVLYTLKKWGIDERDARTTDAWAWFRRHRGFRGMNLAAQLMAIATEQVDPHEIPLINKLTTDFFSRHGAFSLVGVGSWRDMLIPYLVWNFYRSAEVKGLKVSRLSPARVASAGKLFGFKIDANEFDSKKEFWAQEGLGWLLSRQQSDGSWCGYIPCLLYSSIALSAASKAGVADFSTQVGRGWQAMTARRVNLPAGDAAQAPSTKAVWDTARTLTALNNVPAQQRVAMAVPVGASVDWLLANEIKTPGNWSIELPGVDAAGWSFQTNNVFNPDTDDTSQVIRALLQWRDVLPAKQNEIKMATAGAVNWILHFQQHNGGFAAFSKMNFRMLKAELFLYGMLTREHLPNLFLNADNDVTARVVVALKEYADAYPESENAAQAKKSMNNACQFLKRSMKTPEWAPTGVWNATWMIDYLHGTAQVVDALLETGCATANEMSGSVNWLVSVQNASGGWGESAASYDKRQYVKAPATLTQTEFVVEALIAYQKAFFTNTGTADPLVDGAIQRALHFLTERTAGVDSPKPDGVTETFIPKIWYVSYELQPHYELVRTLATYAQLELMVSHGASH